MPNGCEPFSGHFRIGRYICRKPLLMTLSSARRYSPRNCILPPRFGHFAPSAYLTSSDTCLPVTQQLPYRSNLLSEITRCLSHGICTRQGAGCVAVVVAMNESVYWHHRTQRGSSRMEFLSRPRSSLESGFSLQPAMYARPTPWRTRQLNSTCRGSNWIGPAWVGTAICCATRFGRRVASEGQAGNRSMMTRENRTWSTPTGFF